MRTRSLALLLMLLAPRVPLRAASPADWRGRLAGAIREAVSRNPEIAGMDADIAASAARAREADALPDPELTVGVMNLPVDFSFGEDPMTMKTVGLTQDLPPAGMRAAARAAARAARTSLEHEHAHHVAEVAARTASAFFAIASLDARLAIARQTRQLLDQDEAAARERYRVGRGAQADVLRASLEKTRLAREIVAMEAERREAAARFDTLLFRDAGSPVATIEGLDPDEAVPDRTAFLARALAESPVLAHYDQEIARAEQEARAARLERRPAWSLMASYGQRERGDDMVSASVGVSIPWLHPRRLDARAAEADAMVAAARAGRARAEATLRGGIEEALARLAGDVAEARLYQDSVIPQARINDQAAREAYAVGSIDFTTLVSAAIDLQTFRAEYAAKLAAIGGDRAQLQMASGLALLPGTPQMEMNHESH